MVVDRLAVWFKTFAILSLCLLGRSITPHDLKGAAHQQGRCVGPILRSTRAVSDGLSAPSCVTGLRLVWV